MIANDISEAQLRLAASAALSWSSAYSAPRIEFVHSDMLSLAFPPASFDAIMALYSVIHLPREEQKVMIEKLAAWVKPGGVMVVNFAEKESEGSVNEAWLGVQEGWMFWSSWGAERSVKMVEESGFEVLEREVVKDGDGGVFVWVVARKNK
jgi:ubiquinone/menaquinone biosynthesis C-methylase UbiE